MNLLFICSRNNWRSPTAEAIYSNVNGIQVKSAGTEPSAKTRVSAKQLEWAEMIFVMEKKHKERLNQKFGALVRNKKIIVLDIPDEFEYMDPELIAAIQIAVNPYLKG